MKKVLILAYDFPPYVSVGGLRPYSWYKYFKEFELYPIVVTRQWGNSYGNQLDYVAPSETKETIVEETKFGTIIRTAYKPNFSNRLLLKFGENRFRFLRRVVTAFYELAQFAFFLGTKSRLYYGAKDFLRLNKVDLIIATGEPHILFKYASVLSRRYNIPWIADYRDPWSQSQLRNTNILFRICNRYYEKKFLQNVSSIVTVSNYFESQIKLLLPDKSYCVVTNGYDPDSEVLVNNVVQNNHIFHIAYAGTIYNWHPIEAFLTICHNFIIDRNISNVKISFYGINAEPKIRKLIDKKFKRIEEMLSIYPKLTNADLFIELASKSVMLLFNDYTIVGTKIFDYLALKRYILLCFSDDAESKKLKEEFFVLDETKGISCTPQADIINQTNSGYVVKDSQEFTNILEKLYDEFMAVGYVSCDSKNYEKYSRRFQTSVIAELIHNTIKNEEREMDVRDKPNENDIM